MKGFRCFIASFLSGNFKILENYLSCVLQIFQGKYLVLSL